MIVWPKSGLHKYLVPPHLYRPRDGRQELKRRFGVSYEEAQVLLALIEGLPGQGLSMPSHVFCKHMASLIYKELLDSPITVTVKGRRLMDQILVFIKEWDASTR